MNFVSVKCDECQRIQDGANHWMKVKVWTHVEGGCAGMLLGEMTSGCQAVGDYTRCKVEIHDLCGQGCAVKHIAKLLGWNVPTEAG